MKKGFFRTIALSFMMLATVGTVSAQKDYEYKPVDPELQTMAQQVLDQQLSDPDAANKTFTKLMKKLGKDKDELMTMGKFFLDKKVYPCANMIAKQLYTADPTFIPGLMFNGEVCMMRKAYGEAGQKFDEVLAIDSTYVPALRRNAFVYKNINPHVAIEMLQKIKNIEPNNNEADKELGDIYYGLEDYDNAIKFYKTYDAAIANKSAIDFRSAENYMLSLFAKQKFMEISTLVPQYLQAMPDSMKNKQDKVFKSLKFYADVENYELDKAKADMEYITSKAYPDSVYNYRDYTYASGLMKELNNIPEAIKYMEEAIKSDPAKAAAYKELASLYRENKQTDEGLATYRKYIKMLGDKAEMSDMFGLVFQYQAAAQDSATTATQKAQYIADGNAICDTIIAKMPDAYQAYLLKARINIKGDKPDDNVKSLYEKALQHMEGKENTQTAKVEALRYLTFYFVQKDDKASARKYCDEILKLEPDNAFAKQVDGYLKAQ